MSEKRRYEWGAGPPYGYREGFVPAPRLIPKPRTTGGFSVEDGDNLLRWSRSSERAWALEALHHTLQAAVRRHEIFLVQTHDLSELLPR